MVDGQVETYTRGAERLRLVGRRRRHWSVRLLIVVVVLAAVVAYVIYMSLGMPGMDHTPTGGSAPSSQRMLAPALAPASGR